ncbi:glycosyltransferase [Algoriphagus sp. H41]|uniref:Glycosyltransferase n=1 Tax=Algoriphagus oliviformis TaxID=2811231 RepID=A0ABS3C3P5_9BACT|nr:glycosyltransferase [Algoriphagus oliviformis]MBN7810766.1 glycosyltransferase [Algoriphagus oliviformis]
MKRILHIQFSSKSGGSAAWKLHEAFLAQPGFTSEVLSLHPNEQETPGLVVLPERSRFKAKVNNRLGNMFLDYDKSKFGLFSQPLIGTDVSKHPSVQKADVIYIHWVQMGVLTLGGFEKLVETGKQIIIFMHDMWAITGGCHNSFDCLGYQSDCKGCPILNRSKSLAARQLKWKESIFNRKNVFFVSPSRWLKSCAEESTIARNRPVHYIPNYFNSKAFVPKDKVLAKRQMGISPETKVIVFGAVNLLSPYKGFKYLEKALNHLPNIYQEEDVLILIFGSAEKEDMERRLPYNIKFLGYLGSEQEVAEAFQASDVFVIPSIMDNQPTVIVESLSCGVPVVGFEIGGIPDMVKHKANGYLAQVTDYQELAEGIKYCLEEQVTGYQLDNFGPAYVMELHNEMIDEQHAVSI